LNQFTYRQEAVLQITQLEQSLIHSLVQSQSPNSPSASFNSLNYQSHGAASTNVENMRAKMKLLTNHQDTQLLERIVEIYDTLKKCYVVARKAVVKDTLDVMAEGIENLIHNLSKEDPDKLLVNNSLSIIFNSIESLRFSANRDSRCSRNLFEKAKVARHQLRKACLTHPMGHSFIKEIAVSRVTILKDKER
jgi:hypothetical protein